MKWFKYIGISIFICASFLIGEVVLAARFDLSPSSTEFIEGCDSAVNISIDTEGLTTDAANILVHYNPVEIDIVDENPALPGTQIRTGNAYEAYVDNTVLPDEGLIRLTGFSFVLPLNGQATFGTIIFRGKPGVTSTGLTIEFIPGSTTDSNIAEYLTSDDILTGVTNGSYTFRVGDCVADTTPPWVTDPNPAPGDTGVPLDANISFHIKDNQSGVNLASVNVKVNGIEYSLAGPNTFTYTGNPLDYAVTVDPIEDFESGVAVLVEINGADLAGNQMAPYRYIFNEPPVPPPPPPSCESLGCADPQTCAEVPDLPEQIEEEPTVPESQRLNLVDVNFYVADGALQIFPDESDELTTLIDSSLVVSISFAKFPREVDSVIFTLGNYSYFLGSNPESGAHQTTITVPALVTRFPFTISIAYKDGAFDRIDGTLNLLPYGYIFSETTDNRLAGAKITLYEEYASFRVWDGSRYNQNNPQYTDEQGNFAFLVPPGTYYLLVQKDGYRDTKTVEFEVKNNVVNPKVEMIVKPLPLTEVWNPEAPFIENLGNVAGNLFDKSTYAGKVAQQEFFDNPKVEEANESAVVPAVAAVAIVSYSTAISLAALLPFLQFLFTQPILLLFPRRRKGWGIVYNSLSKIPVDLAIVRIYDKVTGRLVQTRVTDREGRYAFLVQPGTYYIRVTKPGFSFPTYYLRDKKEDVKYLDVYHGEEIVVSEKDALVTPNIPIDPVEIEKAVPDRKILLVHFGRKVQDVIAVLGIAAAAVSVVISPKLWIVGVLAAHCLLYVLMKRLSRPRRPKSWGIVYEQKTKARVGRAIARIFDVEYNKLLETQVTDHAGRYSFLVGNSIYYVTFYKPGFKSKRTEALDLRKVEKGAVVGLDVVMEKT